MEYAAAGQAGSALSGFQTAGDVRNATTAVEQKALDSAVRQMEKQLALIAEGVNRVQMFKNRLLNPRPQSVAEKSPGNPPQPSTLEGRLQTLVGHANSIGSMLHEVAGELERAA